MEGFTALIIVILIRTFVPFTLFRWPLFGAVLAILADISDVMIFEAFGSGPLEGELYHNFDKIFDTYYLFFEFLVLHKWVNTLARRTGKILFLWRFAGFTLFEFTGIRPFFTLAPNIFEHWYLAWTVIKKWWPQFALTKTRLFIILFIVGAPKVVQEYIMHYAYPDQTWIFLRDHLFYWIYN